MKTRILKPFISVWKAFRKQSRKKKAILLILILAIAYFAYNRWQTANKPPEYELESARFESITELVSETGNVTTAGAIPLYSTTNGLVELVLVKNGDTVAKNAPLLKVTATATKQEKDTALSTYLTAKSVLETAQATQLSLQAAMFGAWDSFKNLAEGDEYEDADGHPKYPERNVAEFNISEKNWLAAEAAYKKQQVAISQAQAQTSAAWQAYQATQDSQVTAIIDGEIRNLSVTQGDRVVIPTITTISTTMPVLVLYQPNVNTTIKLDISETDIVKVKPGQSAEIKLDAFPDRTFTGHVDRVDTITTPTASVVNYSVYVVIDNPAEDIQSGMTADVDITVSSKDNALIVPSSAVKPYEGGRAVRVVGDKGEVEYIPVQVGARGNGHTEILSGIDEGTQVIVALKNEQVEKKSSLF